MSALREQIAQAIESACLDATFEGENYSRGFWAGIAEAARIARATESAPDLHLPRDVASAGELSDALCSVGLTRLAAHFDSFDRSAVVEVVPRWGLLVRPA